MAYMQLCGMSKPPPAALAQLWGPIIALVRAEAPFFSSNKTETHPEEKEVWPAGVPLLPLQAPSLNKGVSYVHH